MTRDKQRLLVVMFLTDHNCFSYFVEGHLVIISAIFLDVLRSIYKKRSTLVAMFLTTYIFALLEADHSVIISTKLF